jgi:serine/threonine protein kinase/Tfp pilus assembly protein PilF
MIGQTISHYKITAKLGAGGMGEVYLAEDTKLHRRVALKFLPESLHQDTEARERLAREAQAASQLSHPNIVGVYSIEEFDGREFIAMEYVDGIPVNEYCRENSPGLDELLGIVIGLSNGISAAHSAGIIHRDLKPSNVMVAKDGRARILDFGLAKIEGATKLTKTGSTVGTVAYMSPEQGRGEEADHRSDIFSLGAILYEMITGHAPFAGDHEAAIIYATANEEPEPLARYKKNVPDEIQRIVTKCLAKRRKDRYQSTADLATDLKLAKRALAPGSSAVPSEARVRRGSRGPVILGLALVAAIAAVLLIVRPWETGHVTGTQTEDGKKTLVVLPFENLGSGEDEYFADGITDEITTRLAQISELHVISRNSAMQYKGTDKDPRQIGNELGVEYVLAGTIRWDKSGDTNLVRISPQLIKAEDDFYLWTEIYERAMTQIFAVQSDIAGHISSALDVALENGAESRHPTDNLDAYDFYLRGKDYLQGEPSESRVLAAIDQFEKAIALDSQFAEPYAGIGVAISSKLWLMGWNYDREELRTRAREMTYEALRLAPDLPVAHLALGLYYNWMEGDYDLALREFSRALELGQKEGAVYHAIAWVLMRQGRWSEAESNLREGLTHDPRSVDILGTLTELYTTLRRFDDGLRVTERALTLAPDKGGLYRRKAVLLMSQQGDTAEAAGVLRQAVARLNSAEPLGLRVISMGFNGGLWRFRLVHVVPSQVRAAFARTRAPSEMQAQTYGLAVVYDQLGQHDSALVYYDSLLVLVDRRLQVDSTSFDLKSRKGLLCMLAGDDDEALRYARAGMEQMPTSSCHW